MMFADRTNWNLTPNPLAVELQKFKDSQRPFLDLTMSNPTQCGLDYPSAEIVSALNSPQNLDYQPSAQGLLKARERISSYYAQRGVAVDPEDIFLTASTSEAYSFVFRLLADPGDEILFPKPSYPLFDFLVDLNDVRGVAYPLVWKGAWRMDLDSLRRARTPQTRAIVLVHPNNPTGSYLKPEEVRELNLLSRDRPLALICDEVFHDFHLADGEIPPSLSGNHEQLTFTLNGLSKILGLPQMKLSWIVVSGPEEIKKEAKQRLEIIADTFLSVNTPVQNALTKWLDLLPSLQVRITRRLKNNLGALNRLMAGVPECQVLPVEGGWYAVLRLPPEIDEERLALGLMREDSTYVHPGFYFDFAEDPHLVLSLLVPEKDFCEGAGKIKRRLTS